MYAENADNIGERPLGFQTLTSAQCRNRVSDRGCLLSSAWLRCDSSQVYKDGKKVSEHVASETGTAALPKVGSLLRTLSDLKSHLPSCDPM
jgi:hypothetical protein